MVILGHRSQVIQIKPGKAWPACVSTNSLFDLVIVINQSSWKWGHSNFKVKSRPSLSRSTDVYHVYEGICTFVCTYAHMLVPLRRYLESSHLNMNICMNVQIYIFTYEYGCALLIFEMNIIMCHACLSVYLPWQKAF